MCLKMARSLNLETGRPLPEGKTDVLTSYAGYKELLETNVKAANILSFVSHYFFLAASRISQLTITGMS